MEAAQGEGAVQGEVTMQGERAMQGEGVAQGEGAQGEGWVMEAIRQGAGDTQKESLGLTFTAQPEA